MKFFPANWKKYFIQVLVLHSVNISLSNASANSTLSLNDNGTKVATNNRPYVPLNSLTFQATDNGGLYSWMNEGPTVLKQILKKSKLGGSSQVNTYNKDDIPSLISLVSKPKVGNETSGLKWKNENFKDTGKFSFLIGNDKSIIKYGSARPKSREKLESRNTDWEVQKAASPTKDLFSNHSTITNLEVPNFKKANKIQNRGIYANKEKTENRERSSLKNEDITTTEENIKDEFSKTSPKTKAILNRRFIPSDSKVKLAELEKTKPSKADSNSNIIWIFTTPEHNYTLSGTTESFTPEVETLSTQQPTTESDLQFAIDNSDIVAFSDYIKTETATNQRNQSFTPIIDNNVQEPFGEGTTNIIDTTETTPSQLNDYIKTHHPVVRYPTTLTEEYSNTNIPDVKVGMPQFADFTTIVELKSTTQETTQRPRPTMAAYTFTRPYPVTIKLRTKTKASSEGNEDSWTPTGSSTKVPFPTSVTEALPDKSQTEQIISSFTDLDVFTPTTKFPEQIITTLLDELFSGSTPSDSERDNSTLAYPTELDILKEIKKVFEILSNDVNLQTGAAINKHDSNVHHQFLPTNDLSVTKTAFNNHGLVTEASAHSPEASKVDFTSLAITVEPITATAKTLSDVDFYTEETLTGILDSQLGNFKLDNKTVLKLEDSSAISTSLNDSLPNAGLPVVSSTTPSSYSTKSGDQHSKYTPLVQLNVWNYLNGHLQLQETQTVPSPTIDIINNPEVSINNEHKQSVLLHPYGNPKIDFIYREPEEVKLINKRNFTGKQNESKTMPSSTVSLPDEATRAPETFEFINILNYLEENSNSAYTTTEDTNQIPENIYEFIMNHDNKNGAGITKLNAHDQLDTTEFIPAKEKVKITNYKVPIKASSFGFHSSDKQTETTAENRPATNPVNRILVKRNLTRYTNPPRPNYVLQPITKHSDLFSTNSPTILNYSKMPTRQPDTVVLKPHTLTGETAGGIFNNTYLPSILQIYHQESNLKSHLVTNHLNTQQFITINNPFPVKINTSSNENVKFKVYNSSDPEGNSTNNQNKHATLNFTKETMKVTSAPIRINSTSSVNFLTEGSIHLLNDSKNELLPTGGDPMPTLFEKDSQNISIIEDHLWNIDSATLVKEYIKRISIISKFFQHADISNPEIASIIENFALKSLLSYVLGEEDILTQALNKNVRVPIINSTEPEKEASETSDNETEYEISIISKLIVDAIISDKVDPNFFNQLSTFQSHNSGIYSDVYPVTESAVSPLSEESETPLSLNNLGNDRPLLLLDEPNLPQLNEPLIDFSTFDWLTTVRPGLEEIIEVDDLIENPTFVDNIKNSVSGITGMIGNLVPSGETFQDCLNKLGCAFALASSLAIGATGVLAIPLIIPFGRKKKQILLEESRIFGQPLKELDDSLIVEQKLKDEFRRVLTYVSHPEEHKTGQMNVMKGNLIKYLKAEFDLLQNRKLQPENQEPLIGKQKSKITQRLPKSKRKNKAFN